MSERTKLGRISHASFGYGGYQDAMIGLSVTLAGKSWGVGDHLPTIAEATREFCEAVIGSIGDCLT